jgi:SRSO17 transposase
MSVPREPKATVSFVDQYCAYYRDVFPKVRSFEYFTALPLGRLAALPRITWPALTRAGGGAAPTPATALWTRPHQPGRG